MDKMREWTNGEHVKFLNSIEASFVRAMLGDGAHNNEHKKQTQEESSSSSHEDCLLRLDRLLPDSCDSTQDLPTRRRGSRYTSTQLSGNMADNNRSTVKAGRKRRRLVRSQPYDASLQDQVVPQGELRRRE